MFCFSQLGCSLSLALCPPIPSMHHHSCALVAKARRRWTREGGIKSKTKQNKKGEDALARLDVAQQRKLVALFLFLFSLSLSSSSSSKYPKQADDLDAVQEQLDDLGITWVRETVVEGGVLVTQVSIFLSYFFLPRFSLLSFDLDLSGLLLLSHLFFFLFSFETQNSPRSSSTTRTTTWSRSATAASSRSFPSRREGGRRISPSAPRIDMGQHARDAAAAKLESGAASLPAPPRPHRDAPAQATVCLPGGGCFPARPAPLPVPGCAAPRCGAGAPPSAASVAADCSSGGAAAAAAAAAPAASALPSFTPHGFLHRSDDGTVAGSSPHLPRVRSRPSLAGNGGNDFAGCFDFDSARPLGDSSFLSPRGDKSKTWLQQQQEERQQRSREENEMMDLTTTQAEVVISSPPPSMVSVAAGGGNCGGGGRG